MSATRHPAEARHLLLRAALDLLHQTYCLDSDNANAPALLRAQDRLDLAALDLAQAVDSQPMGKKPKGWAA